MISGTPLPSARGLCAALLAATAIFSSQVYADTVTTSVVGFINFNPTPSSNGTTRGFTVGAFPLQGASAWTGTVATTPGTTTISGSSASWTANQYAVNGSGFVTYVVRIRSGSSAGRIFSISSNSSNTLTVVLPDTVLNLATSIAAGDSFEIIPVNTLASLFGSTTTSVKFKQSANQNSADVVYIWNGSAWVAYWFDNTQGFWVNQNDTFSDSGSTPILGNQAVWVARISTSSINISYSMSGTVPDIPLALTVSGTSTSSRKFTFVCNPFPVDITLSAMNLTSLLNWAASDSQNSADLVYIWNGSAWTAYWYDNTQGFWVNQNDTFSSYNSTAIPASTGVWIARKSSSGTAESALVSLSLPYSL